MLTVNCITSLRHQFLPVHWTYGTAHFMSQCWLYWPTIHHIMSIVSLPGSSHVHTLFTSIPCTFYKTSRNNKPTNVWSIAKYKIIYNVNVCTEFILNNQSVDMYSLIIEIKIFTLPLFITCPDLYILRKRIWHISSSLIPSTSIYHTVTTLSNLPWPTSSHKTSRCYSTHQPTSLIDLTTPDKY